MNGEGGPRAAAETASQPAKADATSVNQIPPVGPHPTVGVVFVGALLWSSPAAAAPVLDLVVDDDMATPSLSAILAAVRRLVAAGTPPGPQLVLDAIQRVGTLKAFAAEDLRDAVTSGAQPMALREYGAAVVSGALRRRIESASHSLASAAADAPEEALAAMVSRATVTCLDCAARLEELRGEADG